eukprot:TRINITY_DN1294_c0_g2_i1.p1 TRINITY_DN1294_c0_g2~~TRINITY_DN1294_c0_g2_i1.p1  ORF type:complete len:120 (+),score=19.24 TRINITY_DN1294_c0_g2_i1:78-437(+)
MFFAHAARCGLVLLWVFTVSAEGDDRNSQICESDSFEVSAQMKEATSRTRSFIQTQKEKGGKAVGIYESPDDDSVVDSVRPSRDQSGSPQRAARKVPTQRKVSPQRQKAKVTDIAHPAE